MDFSLISAFASCFRSVHPLRITNLAFQSWISHPGLNLYSTVVVVVEVLSQTSENLHHQSGVNRQSLNFLSYT